MSRPTPLDTQPYKAGIFGSTGDHNSVAGSHAAAVDNHSHDPYDTVNGRGQAISPWGNSYPNSFYANNGPNSTAWTQTGGYNTAAAIPADPALTQLDPSLMGSGRAYGSFSAAWGLGAEPALLRGAMSQVLTGSATTPLGWIPAAGVSFVQSSNGNTAVSGTAAGKQLQATISDGNSANPPVLIDPAQAAVVSYNLNADTVHGATPTSFYGMSLPIGSASWAGGVVTLGFSGSHGLASGQQFTVAGLPTGYNGTFTVKSATATTLTYALVANPGVAPNNTGTVTPAQGTRLPTLNSHGLIDPASLDYVAAESTTPVTNPVAGTDTLATYTLPRLWQAFLGLSQAWGYSGGWNALPTAATPLISTLSGKNAAGTSTALGGGTATLAAGAFTDVVVNGNVVTVNNTGVGQLVPPSGAPTSGANGSLSLVNDGGLSIYSDGGGALHLGLSTALAGDILNYSDAYKSTVRGAGDFLLATVNGTNAGGITSSGGIAYLAGRATVRCVGTQQTLTLPALGGWAAADATAPAGALYSIYCDWTGTDSASGYSFNTLAVAASTNVRLGKLYSDGTNLISLVDMRPLDAMPQPPLTLNMQQWGASPTLTDNTPVLRRVLNFIYQSGTKYARILYPAASGHTYVHQMTDGQFLFPKGQGQFGTAPTITIEGEGDGWASAGIIPGQDPATVPVGGTVLDFRYDGTQANQVIGDHAVVSGLYLGQASGTALSISTGANASHKAWINNATPTDLKTITIANASALSTSGLSNGTWFVDVDASGNVYATQSLGWTYAGTAPEGASTATDSQGKVYQLGAGAVTAKTYRTSILASQLPAANPAWTGTVPNTIRIGQVTIGGGAITAVATARGRLGAFDIRGNTHVIMRNFALIVGDSTRTQDEAAFIRTTNGALTVDSIFAVGPKSATAATPALKDFIIVGGPGSWQGVRNPGTAGQFYQADTNSSYSVFGGYGVWLTNCKGAGIRRFFHGRANANACTIMGNTIWSGCGAGSDAAAIEYDSPFNNPLTGAALAPAYGNYQAGQSYESTYYVHTVRYKNNARKNTWIGEVFSDPVEATLTSAPAGASITVNDPVYDTNIVAWRGQQLALDGGSTVYREVVTATNTNSTITGTSLGTLTATVTGGTLNPTLTLSAPASLAAGAVLVLSAGLANQEAVTVRNAVTNSTSVSVTTPARTHNSGEAAHRGPWVVALTSAPALTHSMGSTAALGLSGVTYDNASSYGNSGYGGSAPASLNPVWDQSVTGYSPGAGNDYHGPLTTNVMTQGLQVNGSGIQTQNIDAFGSTGLNFNRYSGGGQGQAFAPDPVSAGQRYKIFDWDTAGNFGVYAQSATSGLTGVSSPSFGFQGSYWAGAQQTATWTARARQMGAGAIHNLTFRSPGLSTGDGAGYIRPDGVYVAPRGLVTWARNGAPTDDLWTPNVAQDPLYTPTAHNSGIVGNLTGTYKWCATYIVNGVETTQTFASYNNSGPWANLQIDVTAQPGPSGATDTKLYRSMWNGSAWGPFNYVGSLGNAAGGNFRDNVSDAAIAASPSSYPQVPQQTVGAIIDGALVVNTADNSLRFRSGGSWYPATNGAALLASANVFTGSSQTLAAATASPGAPRIDSPQLRLRSSYYVGGAPGTQHFDLSNTSLGQNLALLTFGFNGSPVFQMDQTGSLLLNDGANIACGTSTGTTIATDPSQYLGFFGAQPVQQPLVQFHFADITDPVLSNFAQLVAGIFNSLGLAVFYDPNPN